MHKTTLLLPTIVSMTTTNMLWRHSNYISWILMIQELSFLITQSWHAWNVVRKCDEQISLKSVRILRVFSSESHCTVYGARFIPFAYFLGHPGGGGFPNPPPPPLNPPLYWPGQIFTGPLEKVTKSLSIFNSVVFVMHPNINIFN